MPGASTILYRKGDPPPLVGNLFSRPERIERGGRFSCHFDCRRERTRPKNSLVSRSPNPPHTIKAPTQFFVFFYNSKNSKKSVGWFFLFISLGDVIFVCVSFDMNISSLIAVPISWNSVHVSLSILSSDKNIKVTHVGQVYGRHPFKKI